MIQYVQLDELHRRWKTPVPYAKYAPCRYLSFQEYITLQEKNNIRIY